MTQDLPEIKRIMLPTRFAVLSKAAVPYVRWMLETSDATVDVVHVVPHTELIVDPGVPGVGMPVPGPPADELRDIANRRLREFVAENLPDFDGRVRTFSVIGGIVDELVLHATTRSIDLIVMGTHADGVLQRLIFGSIGRAVLEGAPCPVLLVPVRSAGR